MRTCQGLLFIGWLAVLSRVSADRPQTVVATIPSRGFLRNAAEERSDVVAEGRDEIVEDLEVTGFITKNGDIFELPAPRSMGAIEAREQPELEEGMTMCRYGNIVVYSDTDCNKFFRSPAEILARPPMSSSENGSDLEEDDDVAKPTRKKKGNKRRNGIKKKKPNTKKRRKQQLQRRKALKRKQQQSQKRRRNKLKNGNKLGNSQRKNKRRITKNKRGSNANKRRRINNWGEERSEVDGEEGVDAAPLQFTILLNPH